MKKLENTGLNKFISFLTPEEEKVFNKFKEETSLSDDEAIKALIRFIEYPKTYERFKENFDLDISKLIEKCNEFLNQNPQFSKVIKTEKKTADDLAGELTEPAELKFDELN